MLAVGRACLVSHVVVRGRWRLAGSLYISNVRNDRLVCVQKRSSIVLGLLCISVAFAVVWFRDFIGILIVC